MRIRFSSPAKKTVRINAFSGGVDYRSDESVGSAARAKECYNFDFSDGTLKAGYGLELRGLFSVPVTAAWEFTRYDHDAGAAVTSLLFVSTSGELYERSAAGVTTRKGSMTFTSAPHFIGYRLYGEDVAIISSEKDGTYVYNGKSEPYSVPTAPSITSMTIHAERLFVTVGGEKNAVWFSDDLDPTNWDASLTGAGFIEMQDERGAINRVIGFLGYVYAFRERGISRIAAYGAQTDFSVSNLYVSGGRIYPDTVTPCGDAVLFLGEEGLCGFDGVSTTRLLPALGGLLGGEKAVGAYKGGKYYLAFSYDGQSEQNDSLLVYDPTDGRYSISKGFAISGFCVTETEVLGITAGGSAGAIVRCGSALGTALPKRWRIPRNDWGSGDRKTIREISLYTKYAARVCIRGDGGRNLTVNFAGKDDVQRKRVNFSAKRIGFDIESVAENAEISRPTVVMAQTGG